MKLKYDYWLDSFKKVFEVYLKKVHPNWTDKSVKTRVSDAFILFRWYQEEEAWDLTITQGEFIERLRSEMEDMLASRANYKRDAAGYIRAIKELQEFVNLVHLIEKARKLKPRIIQLTFDDLDDEDN